MRKTVLALVAVFVALAMLAPPALAQAPAPRVTINGLVDSVTSWSRNMSITDLNPSRGGDDEWYARMRVRPDITAEVGTTKFVLGLEIDYIWGQVGAADVGPGQRSGASSGADLNTDMLGNIEMKWAYVDFAVPFLPPGSTLRLGAQPFGSLATYKLAAYANGDFAGAVLTAALTPQFKLNLGWVQVEEESTGPLDGFVRGEDYAVIASVDISPMKGFDIKPMYSYFRAEGITNGSARQGRGGVANSTAFFGTGLAGTSTAAEDRHTIGADMRLRVGPISIEPTVLFQWGERDLLSSVGPDVGLLRPQDMSAWLVDIRAGFQAGPLLLEGAVIYTTGNEATEDIRNRREDLHYFQVLNTDTSYYATWAEIWALGIDYFNILNSSAVGLNPGVAIGYDKYGLIRLGARATYAVTPAFSVRGGVTANWTAEKVDTDGAIAATTGLTPIAAGSPGAGGDERYLGTEVNLGFTWRFAPNLAFDLVGGYMFAGDALSSATSTNAVTTVVRPNTDPDDVKTVAARVRYTF